MHSTHIVEQSNVDLTSRPFAPKRRVVALHLLLSLVVMVLAAVLVFWFWFPAEWRQLAGGLKLFAILAGVDVVCGPLLTALLYKVTKSRREVFLDLTLVAAIQLAALGYGLHTLAQARPLALVFEVDRFRVVSSADIVEADIKRLPDWFRPWGMVTVRTLGLRPAASNDERLASFDAALQGVDAGQRPWRWQDYEKSRPEVLKRARPLADLRAAHPDQHKLIDRAVSEALNESRPDEIKEANELLWLPLVSRHSMDWVVLIDPVTLRIRAYVPLDGFK